ncbi:nuclear transport factor 2 family protein [Streptomyces boluensis]|uniref:Nuclear transport factor 2 family protein n=1 Tax=Streptomyces boluensis TaxID=1775135 RepID=A0A964UNS7_9ACTN|nr:nuclear transport factor 2 family protein [Streptomyces boluensis]NBE52668.1 nuclear transport factor 2 family protein [Streptomyces boluensis]
MDDRYAIIETCDRMGWHTDRREWDEAATLFADKVVLDYTSLVGGEPTTETPTEIVESWALVLDGYETSQHLMTNHRVTLDGDTAECTASYQATHRLENLFGGPLWRVGGTYRFHLRRSGDVWKIDALTMQMLWAEGNQGLMDLAAKRVAARKS